MPEAQPLDSTLSVAPGMSVGRIVTSVAEGYGITWDERVTETIHAVNHLYTHIDSRLDGDKPNSYPQGGDATVKEGLDLPWHGYLKHLWGKRDEPLNDPQLTDGQIAAIQNLRAHFDTLELPDEQRRHFVMKFLGWLYTSEYAKTTDHAYGRGGYVRSREFEGKVLAEVFTEALPADIRGHANFEDFSDMLGRLIGGYKLRDSFKDLARDKENGNTALTSVRLGKLALLAPMGFRVAGILRRRFGLLGTIVGKMRAADSNIDDSRNLQRTHE